MHRLTSGIGYGKLRDGSAVFAVLRILDKLTEDSVLIRPLTKEEVLQIVDIFARKVEYSYTQDRFVKYFMEDIFGQLHKMGVLKEIRLRHIQYLGSRSPLRAN